MKMIAQVDSEYWEAARLRTARRFLTYGLFEGRPATTRGQWINPLVMAHLRAAATGARLDVVDRPIFVIGMGRSGTTLLGRILGVHRDVGFLNEPKALWHTVDEHEDVSGFYGKTGARFALDERDASPDVIERGHRLFGYYCRLTRSSRIVDKYPELTYRRRYIRAIFPDARIIALVRHPDAVIESIVTWCKANTHGGADWWGVGSMKWNLLWSEFVEADERRRNLFARIQRDTATFQDRALVEWIVAMEEVITERSAKDAVDLVVRYEDLTTDPALTLERIRETVGLAESPEMVRFATRVARRAQPRGRSVLAGDSRVQAEVDRISAELGY